MSQFTRQGYQGDGAAGGVCCAGSGQYLGVLQVDVWLLSVQTQGETTKNCLSNTIPVITNYEYHVTSSVIRIVISNFQT